MVCEICAEALPGLAGELCPVCALPSPGRQVCGRCQRRHPNFDRSIAAFAYADPVRDMVLALKHGRGFNLVGWLGERLAEAAEGIEADCIVPMPLHRERLARRGFNQAVEIGRVLSRRSGLPLLIHSVVRDTSTPVLAGLRRKERQCAVRGAFRAVESFAGRQVVVVDDVMTSGATLDEVARTLKQRGAARVTNLVVARTLRLPPR